MAIYFLLFVPLLKQKIYFFIPLHYFFLTIFLLLKICVTRSFSKLNHIFSLLKKEERFQLRRNCMLSFGWTGKSILLSLLTFFVSSQNFPFFELKVCDCWSLKSFLLLFMQKEEWPTSISWSFSCRLKGSYVPSLKLENKNKNKKRTISFCLSCPVSVVVPRLKHFLLSPWRDLVECNYLLNQP